MSKMSGVELTQEQYERRFFEDEISVTLNAFAIFKLCLNSKSAT